MTTYGDKQEPSIVTDVTSSLGVPTSGDAPSNVAIVGQADLNNASNAASTGNVYQVTRSSKAIEWFGPVESSLLTNAIIDALNEGAYPVYAVAAEGTTVTGEDHSSVTGTSFTLDNGPIREDVDKVTVTVDGTDQNVSIVYSDPSDESLNTDEAAVNPVTGNVELDSTPSSSLTVDYEYFDYESAVDIVVNEIPDVVDFLVPISERQNVTDYINVAVGNMEDDYNLALAQVGAGIDIDPTGYTNNYDDSRTQTIYPTRFEDGTSALGSYVGLKASLGLTETPINKTLSTNKRLNVSLSRAERGSLIDEHVVPLADEATGVRITDDPTTVTQNNSDEKNLTYGFNRLVADYIIETTRTNQKAFIGKLNSQTVRTTLEGMVEESLTQLQESNAVISYNVSVFEQDAVTADVEMNVELVKPLRFIENQVTIGGSGA